jgi:hypothetical protein
VRQPFLPKNGILSTLTIFRKGTFAINTDHAANLARQPDDWMSWTSISINLAWLGFEDVHTGIDKYIVNIGSTYMNNDLNEVNIIV